MTTDPFSEFAREVEAKGQLYWLNCAPQTSEHDPKINGQVELISRLENWQIERVTFGPYGGVPMHRHPLVDSFEFPLWGSGLITIGRHHFKLDDKWTPWKPLYVSRKTWHGGYGYERGGGFLSVQRWHGPILGSLVLNWEPFLEKNVDGFLSHE